MPSTSPHLRQRPGWGVAYMALSVVCFTLNALLLKYLSSYSQVSPWVCLAFRAIVGLTLIWLVFHRSGSVDFRKAVTSRMLVARGLLGILGTAAYYFTIPPLGPGKATLISNTFVVISVFLAAWFLKEKLTTLKLAGNLVAIIGLCMLIEISPHELKVVTGYEWLALVGAFSGAAAVVTIRQLTQTETSATIYASQCIFVLIGSFVPACFYWPELPASEYSLLLIASIGASVGQLAMTEGFRHLTVAVGGTFQVLVPVFISFGGVMLFSESFSLLQIAGAFLIVLGCYSVVLARS